jgi:CheY-like chemotaxis protein
MYKVVVVDDVRVPEEIENQLEKLVTAALAELGEVATVSCRSLTVIQNEASWEKALDTIIQESPSIVFVDDYMPRPSAGVDFIRLLRLRGYGGYTYIHTGVESERKLRELLDSEPTLLRAHGSGVLPKRKEKREKEVVGNLISFLRQGKENGLPFFQVKDSSAFLELSLLDRVLELLDQLNNFRLFWGCEEQRSVSIRSAFEMFVATFPSVGARTDIERWLAGKPELTQHWRQQFVTARDPDEWHRLLERLRDVLLPAY